MSADKYAQFIAEQQKKLSVSGTNPINLSEKKELSDKQKDIAKLAGDEDKIEGEDFKELRDKKDDDEDDKDDDKKSKSKKDDDDKDVKEEVDQIDEAAFKLTDAHRNAITRHLKNNYGKGKVTFNSEHGGHFATHNDGIQSTVHHAEMKNGKLTLSHFMTMDEETYSKNKIGDMVPRSSITPSQKPPTKAQTMEVHPKPNPKQKNLISGKNKDYANSLQKFKEEASYISEEESDYLAEMVAKGKLPEIADFHKKAADHAYNMTRHHSMMADKSEEVGDAAGFDHHIDRAMQHEYDHEHHTARYEHAVSLKARNQAMKDLKVAKDKASKARDAKRDWA